MPQFTPEDFVRLVTLYVPETVTALSFSPDGTLLAIAAADKVHIFKVPAPLQSAPTGSNAGSSNPNGS